MHVFPADAALVALAGSIAGDAMADAVDAAKLLDVDMDQFAGLFAFIADDLWPWIKRRQSAQPPAAQGHTDGRDRAMQATRYGRPGQTLATEPFDRVYDLLGEPVGGGAASTAGLSSGKRTPVSQ